MTWLLKLCSSYLPVDKKTASRLNSIIKVQRNHHETEYSNVLQALSFTGLTNRVIKWELTFVERTQISILLKHAQICTSDLHLKMFHKLARCYRNLEGKFFRVKQYGRKKQSFLFYWKKKKKKKTIKGKDANRSNGPCPSFVKRPTLS